MNRTANLPVTDSQPFVRARRIDVEPFVFAASLMAMVVAVGLWLPPASRVERLEAPERVTQVAVKPNP